MTDKDKSARAADEPTDKDLRYAANQDPNKNPPQPVAAVLEALTPDSAVLGEPDFDLHVSGENLTASSVIVFAGHDEPTTFNEDGTVSTGINMAVWLGPDTVKVSVRNGPEMSNELDFTFSAASTRKTADDDDDHPHDARGHVRPGHNDHRKRR